MSKTACLCGNCLSDNRPGTIHEFVSFALMSDHEGLTPFFGLPYGSGDKTEVWYCRDCHRLAFYDNDDLRRTRDMRLANPSPISLKDATAKIGVLYDEDKFFDAVEGYLDAESEAGRCPSDKVPGWFVTLVQVFLDYNDSI